MFDNYDLFKSHEADREKAHQKWMDSLPRCSKCGKKIKDMHCYNIGGDLYCEECIDKCRELTVTYYTDEEEW